MTIENIDEYLQARREQRLAKQVARQARTRERRRRVITRRRHWLIKYKLERGCECCGYNANDRALVFQHVNPRERAFKITAALHWGLPKLFEEIKKTQVKCMNCVMISRNDLYREEKRNASTSNNN